LAQGLVAGAGEAGQGNGLGTRVRGPVRLRAAIPAGTVFLAEGTHDSPANALTERTVAVRRVGSGPGVDGVGAIQAVGATEGHAEMPPSAPLDIPPVAGGHATAGGGEGGDA
jgi:NADH-quinone oxidoreductase subunit G